MSEKRNWMDELDQYIKYGDADQKERAEAWSIGIGLQAVDRKKTSDYLLDLAKEHIEGKITMAEVQLRIAKHYEQREITLKND